MTWDPRGLSAAEARERLERDGPNRLTPRRGTPWWRSLAAQLVHFFALMLWVAAGLAFVAGMAELGVAIVVVIVVNGVFAFAQEQRAETASRRLRDLLPASVTVRRDGTVATIDAGEVVVGDLVVLTAGDRIVADLQVVDAHGLELDESAMTGESLPVTVETGGRAWAGTFLVGGEGAALVTATGDRTRLAGVARLTATAERPPSPLARELARTVRTMSVMTVGAGLGFFGVSTAIGMPAGDAFLFAVGVTVALVPEGLLPTVTLSLATGAQRMSRRRALVRHLHAVEALGAATFICTDKTGTLTCNQMEAVEVWTAEGRLTIRGEGYAPQATVTGSEAARAAASRAARAALVCSQGRATRTPDGWTATGDPMEAAIDALDVRLAPDRAGVEEPRQRFAFDPVRRRASALTGEWLVLKGAPDAVLPRCRTTGDAGPALDDMAARGLRVLAVARRPAAEVDRHAPVDEVERDLELLGLIGLEDPPRAHVGAALASCRRAGVRVAMVTGDHPATALAIAVEVGLVVGEPRVLLGAELPDDDEALADLVDHDGVVISRVAPDDKLRIARALQSRDHVVAMTGDGVNDGPALREADIGVAMGRSGTDVAREAADLVLLDDDFATIVAAIEEGRGTFTNIRRFLTYHLTDNVAELTPFVVWALSGGRFPLAIGVLQVLCLDIATDLLPALALGAEPPDRGVLDRPLTGRHVIDAPLLRRVFGVLGPTEAVVEMVAFVVALVAAGWRPGADFPTGHALLAASGAAFSAVVIGQAGNALACRSESEPPRRLGWASTNRLLLGALAVQLLLLVALLTIAPVARLLEHAVPPLEGWLVALAAFPAVLLVDEAHKAWRRRRSARGRGGASLRGGPPSGQDEHFIGEELA